MRRRKLKLKGEGGGVFDVNSLFKIKNPDFNVGLKNMTKLVHLTVAMTVVVNDGL